MKLTKIAAAFMAAAMIPFSSSGMSNFTRVYAENAEAVKVLPDWVPHDFESALDFLNKYGATHIEDGLICVVFTEAKSEGSSPYSIYVTENEKHKDGTADELVRTVYSSENSRNNYEVAVYRPLITGNMEISLLDLSVQEVPPDKPVQVPVLAEYTFKTDKKKNITETDIYSWFPDCITEYTEYKKKNGEISVKDNYVLFCLDSSAGTPYRWSSPQNYYERHFTNVAYADCSEKTAEPLDGGAVHEITALQAYKDGRSKIIFELDPLEAPAKVEKLLVADCIIKDNAGTVILGDDFVPAPDDIAPDTVRFSFVDYDTGKLLKQGTDFESIRVVPEIWSFNNEDFPSTVTVDADTNPYEWEQTVFYSETLDVLVSKDFLPENYFLPEDYKKIIKYDNGSFDVIIKLRKNDGFELPPDSVRITVYDKGTGELIPDEILQNHSFTIATDIAVNNVYTGPVFIVDQNGFIFKSDLASLYKNADYFAFSCDDKPEITLYENNSMDLVFKTELKVSGDVNGDEEFNISDVLTLQKWLLGAPDAELIYWPAADFSMDSRIDVFDLCMMKKALLEANDTAVAISLTETGGYDGRHITWEVYRNDDKYFLSRDNSRISRIPPEDSFSPSDSKTTFEITEQEYGEIMSIDYSEYIAGNKTDRVPSGSDALNYNMKVTFTSGAEKTTNASADKVTQLLRIIFSSHENKD